MSARATVLFEELSQICAQYKAEVPGRRRAWPESVKSRVFELRELGLKWKVIAKKTGLCYQTMIGWKRPESFVPVKVIASKKMQPPTVIQKPRKYRERKTMTVTVITPTGYRIEGLDQRSILLLMESLEG